MLQIVRNESIIDMKVTESTTVLSIFTQNVSGLYDIKVTNETSKALTYDKTKALTQELYYFQIEDTEGFNFTNENTYIIEVFKQNTSDLVYRNTAYCTDSDSYNKGNRINSDNEYITL
jgi:hypothetical protein